MKALVGSLEVKEKLRYMQVNLGRDFIPTMAQVLRASEYERKFSNESRPSLWRSCFAFRGSPGGFSWLSHFTFYSALPCRELVGRRVPLLKYSTVWAEVLICRYASVIKVERNLAFNTIWHSISVICEKYSMSFLKLHLLFCKGTWCRRKKQTEGAHRREWRWRVLGMYSAIEKIQRGVIWSCGDACRWMWEQGGKNRVWNGYSVCCQSGAIALGNWLC